LSIKAVELLFRVDWLGRSAVFVDGAAEDTPPQYGRVDLHDTTPGSPVRLSQRRGIRGT
jgi:hypothetical protein